MPNNHVNKYFTKMLFGITLVSAGIFLCMFVLTHPTSHDDWFLWAIGVSLLVNAGLILLCYAFVHKVKSDLIRKQKHYEQHKTFTADKPEIN